MDIDCPIYIINLKENDNIAAIAKVIKDDEAIDDINEIDVNDGTVIE